MTRLWPQAAYYNLYGPTETNVCTFARIPLPVPEDRTAPYPIGWPCSHCDALVLDEDGQESARREEGLLYIAGPSVFPGYWNRPEHNAKAVHRRDGQRWYNTGDVVRQDPQTAIIYRRPPRPHGQAPRLPDRARRDRARPLPAPARPRSGGRGRARSFRGSQNSGGPSRRRWCSPQPSIIELKMFCGRQLPSWNMSPDAFVFLNALPRHVNEQSGLSAAQSLRFRIDAQPSG